MSRLDITLSTHAKQRLAERAEDWRKIPLGKIRRSALCHPGLFTVRQGVLSYICKWTPDDRILIITVIRKDKKRK